MSDFVKVIAAGPMFFASAWVLMIFAGIVYQDVGIHPFGYATLDAGHHRALADPRPSDRCGRVDLWQAEEVTDRVDRWALAEWTKTPSSHTPITTARSEA